jgi:hypothetical protein
MAFDKNNICKDLAWKVPFENYEFLTPEFYAEKNLEILYKDYVYDKRKKVYLIDKECDNPIVLDERNFNDFSSIPMMFKDLPFASTDDEYNSEGFLLYGYKNIDERSYFDTEDPAYNNSLSIMIKALFYIKNIIFDFFNEKCVFKLKQEGCSTKANPSCCGFTAPIFACILNQYLLHYTKYEPLDADKLILIDMAKSYYKAISGYERSRSGVGIKCKGFTENNFAENGVYLVALYDRRDFGSDDCNTFHHFIVYIHNEFCILIDSWSSEKGSREEWLRIMKTSDMKRVLKYIGSTENLYSLNEWLNIFFCIPHGNNGSDPASKSYYYDSFYEEDSLCSVGAIFLGHNTSGYWYKHAGRQRLPTKEWRDYVKAEELKIGSSSSPRENIFENPYERRKSRLTRKNKRINKFGWKTDEWKGKTSKNGGRKRN